VACIHNTHTSHTPTGQIMGQMRRCEASCDEFTRRPATRTESCLIWRRRRAQHMRTLFCSPQGPQRARERRMVVFGVCWCWLWAVMPHAHPPFVSLSREPRSTRGSHFLCLCERQLMRERHRDEKEQRVRQNKIGAQGVRECEETICPFLSPRSRETAPTIGR